MQKQQKMRELLWMYHRLYRFNNNTKHYNFNNQHIYWKLVKHDTKSIKNDQNIQEKHQIRFVIIIYEAFFQIKYLYVLISVICKHSKRLLCARIKYLMKLDLFESTETNLSQNRDFIIHTHTILINTHTVSIRQILHCQKMQLQICNEIDTKSWRMRRAHHWSGKNLSLIGFEFTANDERKRFFERLSKTLKYHKKQIIDENKFENKYP
eukprot:UN13586